MCSTFSIFALSFKTSLSYEYVVHFFFMLNTSNFARTNLTEFLNVVYLFWSLDCKEILFWPRSKNTSKNKVFLLECKLFVCSLVTVWGAVIKFYRDVYLYWHALIEISKNFVSDFKIIHFTSVFHDNMSSFGSFVEFCKYGIFNPFASLFNFACN